MTKSKKKKSDNRGGRRAGSQIRPLKTALGIIIPWLIAAGLYIAAAKSRPFANWYAEHVYPVLVNTIGRGMSYAPVSVVEILLYLLILYILISLVIGAWRIMEHTRGFGESLLKGFLWLVRTAGVLAMIFMLFGGTNYSRETFAQAAGMDVQTPAREELVSFCNTAIEHVNELAPQMKRDVDGCMVAESTYKTDAPAAMAALGEEFPALSGYYPNVKDVFVDAILSYQDTTGFYSPFTIEANINGDMPDYDIPFIACHELSHLKGFMREDEANFIGWLAAVKADKAYMNYSGWLVGFIYAGNALAKYDMETYTQLHAKLDRRVRDDLAYGTAYWKQYEGPVAEIHEQVNDAYLKINHQSDGVESYGRMVELMLAYYEKEMD